MKGNKGINKSACSNDYLMTESPTHIHRLTGEFSYVLLGQGAAVLGSIFGVRLLTSVLPPTRYGELALGMTAATLTQQVIFGPIASASLRFFAPAEECDELGGYLRALRSMLLRGSALLFVLAVLLPIGLCLRGYFGYFGLLCAAFSYSLISGYNCTFDGIQNAARHRPVVAWHQASGQWLRFLLAVGFIKLIGSFSSVAMLGYAVASLTVLISQIVFYRRNILCWNPSAGVKNKGSVDQWRSHMLRYAWPFAVWGTFTWAQLASDRWALQVFSDTANVGLYAVLYQIGYSPIMLLSGSIVQLAAPVVFSLAGDASDSSRMNQTRHLNILLVVGSTCLTALLTIFAFLFHEDIFALLVAAEYRRISHLFPLVVLSAGLFASGQVGAIFLLSNITTSNLIAPKVTSAIMGVILNLLGAYWLGIKGVILALASTSLLYFLWILRLIRTSDISDSSQDESYISEHGGIR
jgi:O-antigen/teichoic acid export membrane protein